MEIASLRKNASREFLTQILPHLNIITWAYSIYLHVTCIPPGLINLWIHMKQTSKNANFIGFILIFKKQHPNTLQYTYPFHIFLGILTAAAFSCCFPRHPNLWLWKVVVLPGTVIILTVPLMLFLASLELLCSWCPNLRAIIDPS